MDSYVRHRSRPVLAPGARIKGSIILENDSFGEISSVNVFPNRTWLLIFLLYFFVFLLVLYCDLIRFPDPVSVKSLSGSERSLLFSEERARNFVRELSSIGPKPTGSHENEVVAVHYILRQLEYIKSHAKLTNKIEIDLQKSSGCFDLAFKDGMTSCYDNVKNIVARIGPQKLTNRSIVINCHFDSVPTSPGASDDVVSCAVMLEVLLSLSQHNQALPNEIIFLFNGAEENILQAAHGFITQHPWAKTAVGFVNLEACGAGGKQMLFQADRDRTWLLMAYANGAPYPQGSVVAQDIFQNGLIPSDTDYRIFEHFGNLPGLDFAYVKNGYVYHTKFDVPEAITEGAIQQAGMNLLNLIHNAIASSDMVEVKHQSKMRLVFFDFMGFFMVVYRVSTALAFSVCIIIFSLVDMILKSKQSGVPLKKRALLMGKAFLVMLCSLVGAYVFCAIIAVFLGVINATMSWYKSPYFITGLYGCASLSFILWIHSYTVKKDERLREKWLREDVYFDTARFMWICILVLMELYGINSSFLCCIWIIFPTLGRVLLGRLLGLVGIQGSLTSHLCVHLGMQVVPLSIFLYCVWSAYNVFVPIMGRIGAMLNPDLLVALFTTLLVFFSTLYTVSLVQVMVSPRKVIFFLLSIVTATVALVSLTPLGFPYSGEDKSPAPMRLYVLHTDRTFHNRNGSVVSMDSGYWVVPLDYNGPKLLSSFMDSMRGAEPIDCDAELACGMPFYMPVISLLRKSYYIPASKPKIHSRRSFQLISRTALSSNTIRLSFLAQGPDHMTVILSPRSGVDVVGWSLTPGTPIRSLDWVNRPTYFVYYSYGEHSEHWKFHVDVQVHGVRLPNSALLDLSFTTHHLHGHDQVTGDFPALLRQVPSWVHATPWTCTLDMHVF